MSVLLTALCVLSAALLMVGIRLIYLVSVTRPRYRRDAPRVAARAMAQQRASL